MSLMKKRLDEINTVVEEFIRRATEDTGERKVCLDSLSPTLRQHLIDHGNLNQPVADPRLYK